MRAQISARAFFYILAVIVIGIMLLLGYNLIRTMNITAEEVALEKFKGDLTHSITSISNNYKTVKKETFILSKKYKEVCFVDLSKKERIEESSFIKKYPLIKDGLDSEQNIYLYSDRLEDSFHVDNLVLNHYPYLYCVHNKNGRIEITFEGEGNQTLLQGIYKNCVTLQGGETASLQSQDEIVTLVIAGEAATENREVCIEIHSQGEDSDSYQFTSSNTEPFDPPAELLIQTAPNPCPLNPVFIYTTTNGQTKQIQGICDDKVAVFRNFEQI